MGQWIRKEKIPRIAGKVDEEEDGDASDECLSLSAARLSSVRFTIKGRCGGCDVDSRSKARPAVVWTTNGEEELSATITV